MFGVTEIEGYETKIKEIMQHRLDFIETQDVVETTLALNNYSKACDCGQAADLSFEAPLKIVEYPDPILRTKNRRIDTFDDNLKKLVDEMFDCADNRPKLIVGSLVDGKPREARMNHCRRPQMPREG
ncbi:hypothetical protein CsSME_00015125 [Camellia sinensis var. sinensis]